MSYSKIFIPNSVGVLIMKRYKTYQTGFLFCCLGHAPEWDFGALGVPRGSNIFFIQTYHIAYQIDGDDEQNKMRVTFSS